jgi:RNA polymerase sigma-70 factor, ECF subfamily
MPRAAPTLHSVSHETAARRWESAPDVITPTEAMPDEADLVQAILRRDRKATAEFVTRYSDRVYAYVRRRLLPRVDIIEDVVQDVFVAALESLTTYAGASSLGTWLLGIARHKVEDYYRDCLKRPMLLGDLEDGVGAPVDLHMEYDELLDREKRDERVQRVLIRLPEAYRAVLVWRYWEKRSAREMAAQCGRTEKAIERLLARARYEFRRRWNEK